MSDSKLRLLERAASMGDPASRVAFLREQLRAGSVTAGEEHAIQVLGRGSVMDASFTPSGEVLTTGFQGVQLWNLASRQEVRRFSENTGVVSWQAVASPNGLAVLSAFGDATACVWELGTGRELWRRRTEGIAYSMAFSPDGAKVLLATAGKRLHLLDARTGEELRVMKTKSSGTRSVAWMPDGHHAVTGGFDKLIRLWDLDDGSVLQVLAGHDKWIECVDVGADGRTVVSVGRDRVLRVWDLEAGRELACLPAHKKVVQRVALSPTARQALTASNDGTIKLWDLTVGSELAVFKCHEAAVTGVRWSPDGLRAVSSGEDGTARTWILPLCDSRGWSEAVPSLAAGAKTESMKKTAKKRPGGKAPSSGACRAETPGERGRA